jgi:hypothetical protein
MEMMEYESEGIMAEALTFTDNQTLLVKNHFMRIFKRNLCCFLFSLGTFYG